MQSLEREIATEREEARETASRSDRLRRNWRITLAGAAVVIVAAAFLAIRFQGQINARLDAAAARATAAEQQAATASENATRQIAATKADADRQIAEARQAALKAEVVSNLLAAPDLIRFNLVGTGDAERAYAQVLWSRTRGMVVSGSRLPALPAGSVYQVWLLTETEPVSAGLLTPDASGRATMMVETPPSVPRRVVGANVTVEPAGGAAAPSGAVVLARPQQQ
jgi:anti-sigma-K factor RskA